MKLRHWLFRGIRGCSNHGCVVTGPKKGMGTNGRCSCMSEFSRSQLQLFQSRLEVLLSNQEYVAQLPEEDDGP